MKYFVWQSLLLLAIPAFVLGWLVASWAARRSRRRVTRTYETVDGRPVDDSTVTTVTSPPVDTPATASTAVTNESTTAAALAAVVTSPPVDPPAGDVRAVDGDGLIDSLRTELSDAKKQVEAQRAEAIAARKARDEAITVANERLRHLEAANRAVASPATVVEPVVRPDRTVRPDREVRPDRAVQPDRAVEDAQVVASLRERVERTEASLTSLRAELEAQQSKHRAFVGSMEEKLAISERATLAARGALEKVQAESAAQLQGLRTRTEKAEAGLGVATRDLDDVRREHERSVADWRTRAETAEAARVTMREQLQRDDATRSEEQRATISRTADLQQSLNVLRAEHDRFTRATSSAQQDLRERAERAEQALRTHQTTGAQRAASVETELIALRTAHASVRSDHEQAVMKKEAVESEVVRLRAEIEYHTAAPDDLERIEGVGPKMAQALYASGVRTYAHLRDASEEKLRGAIDRAGLSFAPSLPTWPKQSAYLAAGDEEGFRRYTEYLIAGRDPAAWNAGGTDGLDGRDAAMRDARDDARNDARDVAKDVAPDVAGVRDRLVGIVSVPVAASAQAVVGRRDDLERVEGIGPRISAALHGAGIHTFVSLAGSREADLRHALVSANLALAPSLGTWAQQARFLAEGDETGFATYVQHLIAGRNPETGHRA